MARRVGTTWGGGAGRAAGESAERDAGGGVPGGRGVSRVRRVGPALTGLVAVTVSALLAGPAAAASPAGAPAAAPVPGGAGGSSATVTRAAGAMVSRLGGADRYETAARIALHQSGGEGTVPPASLRVVRGDRPWDAVASAGWGTPVLFVPPRGPVPTVVQRAAGRVDAQATDVICDARVLAVRAGEAGGAGAGDAVGRGRDAAEPPVVVGA